MERIRGVNVSEIRLLFDPSPPIYCFFVYHSVHIGVLFLYCDACDMLIAEVRVSYWQ